MIIDWSKALAIKILWTKRRVYAKIEEMVSEFGAPSKTISVNEDIKVVSYTYSEDKVRIRQPANYQILIMIEEGIIRNISM